MSWGGLADYPDFTGYEFWFDSAFGINNLPHNQTVYDLMIKSNNEVNPQMRQVGGDQRRGASAAEVAALSTYLPGEGRESGAGNPVHGPNAFETTKGDFP